MRDKSSLELNPPSALKSKVLLDNYMEIMVQVGFVQFRKGRWKHQSATESNIFSQKVNRHLMKDFSGSF